MKVIHWLLFTFLTLSAAAQVRDGDYKGARVKNGKPDPASDVTINVLSLGNGVLLFTEKKAPLNGCYYFEINGRRRTIIANFAKGVPHGEWTDYMYDDVHQKGMFKNGKSDGKFYTYGYENGGVSRMVTYADGVRQHDIDYHQNGQTKEECYFDENGKKHGEEITYNSDGAVIKETRYSHGLLHGRQMRTDSRGVQEFKTYNNGDLVLEREHIQRYANGNKKETGAFDSKNKKTGKWTFWNEAGTIVQEEHYLNGMLNGERKVYDADGKPRSTEEYTDDKLNGKRIEYDENKKVTYEYNYSNGELNGLFKAYNDGKLWRECLYDNGRILREKEYKNGKINVLRLIDDTGKLVDVQEYDASGNPIKRNKNYKKHASIKLKEDASGIIDVE